MFRIMRMYWVILTQVGRALSLGRQIDAFFRYHVLKTLQEDGLFDYIKEPRSYGQILTECGYVDSDYTRIVFDVLVKDKQPLVIQNSELYQNNPEIPFPDLSDISDDASQRIRSFGLLAQGMARYVSARMKAKTVEFSGTFEEDGRQLMTKFDKTLGSKIYNGLRNANFALLKRQDFNQCLRGKKLLEVGCGSGRETADIWLKLEGNVQITAIDPVENMLNLAKESFAVYLYEMSPGHPPLTDENQPVFELVSATELPYENETFDAVFCGFVLHWTPNAQKAISEVARVLKPGGLVFGIQPTKPAANPYFDLVVRSGQNAHGFFWTEEFRRWFQEQQIEIETHTPVNIFRGRKRTGMV